MKKLLTIAIPTYNRPEELEGNLTVLVDEYNRLSNVQKDCISFFISDNASDNYCIEELVKEYIGIIPLTYTVHKSNIGPTMNFEYCYRETDSNYLLLLSDDEYFTHESLSFLIEILKQEEPSLVFLNSNDKFITKEQIDIFDDKNLFVATLDILPTLISSIVFKKSKLDQIKPSYLETNLHQFYYYLSVVMVSDKQIIINNKILYSKYDDNSGGYNWFNTFCTELYTIIDHIDSLNYFNKNIFKNMKKNVLIKRLIPHFLNYKINNEKYSNFKNVNIYDSFKIIFKNNKFMWATWFLLIPIYLIPKSILVLTKKYIKNQKIRG